MRVQKSTLCAPCAVRKSGRPSTSLPVREFPATPGPTPTGGHELKHRRIPGRRPVVAGAGIAALVTAGVTFQSANAGEPAKTAAPRTLSAPAAGKLAATLVDDLGADAAGTYYD